MTNLNVEYAYSRLELAIRINDVEFIIESLDELVMLDDLTIEEKSCLYQVLAICNLNKERFLKSYQSINRSIQLHPEERNHKIMEIVKAKISE